MAGCVEFLSAITCLWAAASFSLGAWRALRAPAQGAPEDKEALLLGGSGGSPPIFAFSHPWGPPAASLLARAAAVAVPAGTSAMRLALLLALPFMLSLVLPPAWTTSCTAAFQVYASSFTKAPVAAYTLLSPTARVDLSWLFGPNAGPSAGAAAGPASIEPCCWVNMYVDVAVYYGLVGAVLAVGAVGLAVPRARALLLRRPCGARVPALAPRGGGGGLKALLPVAAPALYAPSVGELLLLLAYAALVGYWLRYWRWGYQRIQDNASADPGEESAHAWARALGHVATLFLTFALLPLARGSVWEAVFGVPYERALRFHRANGALFWVAVTAHGGVWAAKWARQGLLAANLAASGVPTALAVSPSTSHGNNFTIPLVAGGWLLLTACLLVAVARRWLPWELFTASHTALLWVVLVAELHAWSHWYHTLGPLVLYAFDKVARGARGAAVCEAAGAVEVAAGVTQLEVALPPGGGDCPRVPPGAFFMVCVPQLGELEWHPFTAASVEAPRGGGGGAGTRVVFDVKAMGAGSWSSRLGALAALRAPGAPPLLVQLEGPHGGLAVPRHAAHVFAVAGGIGITPIAALVRAMLQAAAEGRADALPALTLVWAVRSVDVLGVAGDALCALLDASDAGTLRAEVHLHLTGTGGGESSGRRDDTPTWRALGEPAAEGAGGAAGAARWLESPAEDPTQWPAVRAGRCAPASAQRLARLATPGRPLLGSAAHGVRDDGTVAVLACGPSTLTDEALALARLRGWEAHVEVFHL
jgi:predicted ferric reductase